MSHTLRMIHPKLEYQLLLAKKVQLVDALRVSRLLCSSAHMKERFISDVTDSRELQYICNYSGGKTDLILC